MTIFSSLMRVTGSIASPVWAPRRFERYKPFGAVAERTVTNVSQLD
jgi:hypothetical protein